MAAAAAAAAASSLSSPSQRVKWRNDIFCSLERFSFFLFFPLSENAEKEENELILPNHFH